LLRSSARSAASFVHLIINDVFPPYERTIRISWNV
jgi:hypothetical protein